LASAEETSEKWRFQDRFIVTCVRPYSGVETRDLGLELGEGEWLEAAGRKTGTGP